MRWRISQDFCWCWSIYLLFRQTPCHSRSAFFFSLCFSLLLHFLKIFTRSIIIHLLVSWHFAPTMIIARCFLGLYRELGNMPTFAVTFLRLARSDSNTPILIWNSQTRSELRAYLDDIEHGLFRKRKEGSCECNAAKNLRWTAKKGKREFSYPVSSCLLHGNLPSFV